MEDQDILIDTHTHLASSRFQDDVAGVVSRADDASVSRLVAIACDLEDSETNLKLASEFDSVSATVGIHPLYVHEIAEPDWEDTLGSLVTEHSVAAIGEIGLDYFHPPADGSSEELWHERQRDVFERQLQIAQEHNMPVVIHQRNSSRDVMEVLRNFPSVRSVLHCFTGTKEEAEEALSLGCYLSFTGIVTFPNAESVRESASIVPLDRVMVETDSPYLAPVPFRGKQCEPFMVRHTASRLAEIYGISNREIAQITTSNARDFFSNLE